MVGFGWVYGVLVLVVFNVLVWVCIGGFEVLLLSFVGGLV